MKRIALAMALAALAAPASAFTQNESNVTTTGLASKSATPAQEQVAMELGPWSAVIGKGRSEAFRRRQIGDDGGSFDGGRRYQSANEDKKGRNVPRRLHGDPGDSGGRRDRVNDPNASGDSHQK
ncbi:MAG: hypothetical protein ACRDGR_10860 [bacterium]